MKLVIAIVHNEDAGTLVDALLEKEYRATRFNSSGGFLKQGNATILVGVEDDRILHAVEGVAVDSLLDLRHVRLKTLYAPLRPQADSLYLVTRDEIRQVLSPAQREQFEQVISRTNARSESR